MTIPCDPPSAPQAAGTMKKKLIPALLGGAVGLFLLLGGSRLIPGISDGSGQATEMPARAPGEAYEVSLDAYRQALESRIASIWARAMSGLSSAWLADMSMSTPRTKKAPLPARRACTSRSAPDPANPSYS